MPLKLAYGQFFDHTQMGDDAIVAFVDPTKQMHIGLLTIKLNEGLDIKNAAGDNYVTGRFDNTDDLDAYVALMTYKFSDAIKAGINYTYLSNSDLGFSQQNLGLHADGKVGNFGYQAAADFQFGKVFKNTAFDERTFKGWAASLKADYKLGDPVLLRGSFVYGSGEDEFDPINGDDDIKEFTPYVGTSRTTPSSMSTRPAQPHSIRLALTGSSFQWPCSRRSKHHVCQPRRGLEGNKGCNALA